MKKEAYDLKNCLNIQANSDDGIRKRRNFYVKNVFLDILLLSVLVGSKARVKNKIKNMENLKIHRWRRSKLQNFIIFIVAYAGTFLANCKNVFCKLEFLDAKSTSDHYLFSFLARQRGCIIYTVYPF